MIVHVLPGDAYADAFRETGLEGEVAVFRECLVDGEVGGESLAEFWRNREKFLTASYPDPGKPYAEFVVDEIEKFANAGVGDEVNLWFEYDLFCNANYWFCLNMLTGSGAEVYRIAPAVRDEKTKWLGFGGMPAEELLECWKHRVRLNDDDLELGRELWQAFRKRDSERLLRLGTAASPAFPHLIDAAEAAAEIDTRPLAVLNEIRAEGIGNFNEIFAEFQRRAGVYGFGDAQVKRLME